VLLYGLGRKRRDWCLLVEGETDCWTSWAHDLPALGIPGKSTWKAEWAEHFRGVKVFLWQEPDAPELPAKIGKDLPDLMVIRPPEGLKDLNEAHVKGEDIPALVEMLKAQAIPASSIIKAQADKRLAELRKAAGPVLALADPLQEVQRALQVMGFGGDPTPALITYLSVTSRLLAMRPGAMPVHLLLFGQASAGKSYVLQIVLRLFPEWAYHVIPAGSSRVLIHDDSELRHRAVIFGESDSLPAGEDNPAASAIRNLLQDHHLHYDVTVRDPETSQFTVKKVHKEGPSVLLTTSTKRLGYQLETRLFILEVGDSTQKIAAALETQANIEESGEIRAADEALVAFQDFLQAQVPIDVKIPFVKPLSALIAKKATAPRILRDFARLLSLVKSAAVVRQAHRQRDDKGRLIANLDDYDVVFNLVGPRYEATLTGASKELRGTVQAVGEMLELGQDITATTLASKLKINRGTASRRVNAAIKRGWLINKETKKGQPWDLHIGEPLPEHEGLPTPDGVSDAWEKRCGVAPAPAAATEIATQQPFEIIDDDEGCCTVAGDTGELFPSHEDDQDDLREVAF
jgi:hypothetical protein